LSSEFTATYTSEELNAIAKAPISLAISYINSATPKVDINVRNPNMLRSIAGTYENGTVKLTAVPPNIRSSKVIVTCLDSIDVNISHFTKADPMRSIDN
jgi:hypothetical protein